MQEANDRLKWARIQRGWKDATAAATRFAWNQNTYRSHENGARAVSKKAALAYARSFKVPVGWLLYGEGSPNGRPATKVFGIIRGGSDWIIPFDDSDPGAEAEEVDLPPGAPPDAIPVEVRGNSMWPRYFEGEKLFYVKDGRTPNNLIGRECVVKLHDGRAMVKILRRGSRNGLFNLESWNAPTEEDVKIEWAAEVRWRASP